MTEPNFDEMRINITPETTPGARVRFLEATRYTDNSGLVGLAECGGWRFACHAIGTSNRTGLKVTVRPVINRQNANSRPHKGAIAAVERAWGAIVVAQGDAWREACEALYATID
jgi:hypothetical protein